jgi:TetR/AcrR family transcriptional regulator, fatty acid metabolism regulator protein
LASPDKLEARKEQILKAAIKVFAGKGFQKATISEIAKTSGVSDATIYEHFSTKEELLFTIPVRATQQVKGLLKHHLGFMRGAANKLRGIIYGHMLFLESDPDFASVALLTLRQNREFLETEGYRLMEEWSVAIIDVVKEGIASGEFRPDTDPVLVRFMMIGSIETIATSWLLLGKPKSLMEMVDPLTDVIINGIRKNPAPEGWDLHVRLAPSSDTASTQAAPVRIQKRIKTKKPLDG